MKLLRNMSRHPELIILILMVIIIAMLIIPLPTYLIDFLIATNMVLAILIFLGSFYVERILNFSSFPSILLITTLFRLSLAISTSRLILLEANAGEIITSFGNFVIGESLAVGFVIFSIVTIVQFIVITKGSERVAEVAARFSLDGMPGKQMSIDADLRAGIIDADTAKLRRSTLEKESQLYGSFDGAMKFIKGDAIANIIIIFVNIIGGLSVGVGKNGMDISSALTVYTILTVGDGLVSQIPALLIAISAGFIVTRVEDENNSMGVNIVKQLFNNPFVLMVTAILTFGLGFLPGFPTPVFMLLSVALLTCYYLAFMKGARFRDLFTYRTQTQDVTARFQTETPAAASGEEGTLGIIQDLDLIMTETVPLVLLTSPKKSKRFLQDKVCERIKSNFFLDYGIHLPDLIIRDNTNVSDEEVILLINEVRADSFHLPENKVRVIDFDQDLFMSLGLKYDVITRNEENYYWVSADTGEKMKDLGYKIRGTTEELYNCISVYLAHNIKEYFGIQETKSILDALESKYPDLLREVLRYITIQKVSEVIQRLVQERISVRNMRMIMESLASWAPMEKDIIVIVEHVRNALSRYICHKFAAGGEIKVIALTKELEETFREGIRPTSSGTFLHLEPADADHVSDIMKNGLQELNIPMKEVVLVSSVDIRRFVKRFMEPAFPELEVLSYGELTDTVKLNVVKTLG